MWTILMHIYVQEFGLEATKFFEEQKKKDCFKETVKLVWVFFIRVDASFVFCFKISFHFIDSFSLKLK